VVRTIIAEAGHAEGFNPQIPHTAHDLKSIIDLVRAGLGSAPMPASVGNDSYPGIVIKPLADSPMVEVAMASREGEDHTPAGQVVASMRRQLAGSPTARIPPKEDSPGRGRAGHESIHDASVRAPIPASVS
jgi:DNA-binding transcriptional LysR family regulator